MRPLWTAASIVVLLTVAFWTGAGVEPRQATGAKADANSAVERGKYLAHDVAHCVKCHTATTDKGEPDPTLLLRGGVIPFEPKKKGTKWADESPDITNSGLAGMWTEEQMVTFLTTGKNPKGEGPIPPMPVFRLKPEDARAVTAYLRSVPGKKGGR